VRRVRARRSTWFGICVVALLFVSVTFVISSWGRPGPDIPHAVGGDRAACTTCHPMSGLPDGHQGRSEAGCPSCHGEQPADVTAPAGASAPPTGAEGADGAAHRRSVDRR
jgi:hypothetical protein